MLSRSACRWLAPALVAALRGLVASAAPPEVSVSLPVVREVADYVDLVGTLDARESVELRARVPAYVERVHCKLGGQVKKGDLLFELDGRVQKAALDKAKAELELAEARLKLADAEARRAEALRKNNALGQDEFDKLLASRDEAKAATLAARAALDVAKLNLEFTRITSAIDGKVARVTAAVGSLVSGGDKDESLGAVVALDPLYAYVDLDERTFLRMRRQMRESGGEGGKAVMQVGLAAEDGFPMKTVVEFAPRVDPATGTVRARGILPNPKGELLPGMFIRARVAIGSPRKALLVSDAAVLQRDGRKFVRVVNDKNVVEQREVKVRELHDGLRVIEEGLKSDERVIVGGGRSVEAGEKVEPKQVDMPTKEQRKEVPPMGARPAPPPDFPAAGPAIIVTARYRGANARILEDTVAAPIEKQLGGLEGVRHHFVACTDAGELRMTILFKEGTDLDRAQMLVRDRLALAEPLLPDAVRREGVRYQKRAARLLIVALYSADDSGDREPLGKLAARVRDELLTIPGVADVGYVGPAGPSEYLQISIDPDRLRALSLRVSDVMQALQDRSFEGVGGPADRAITLRAPDMPANAKELNDIVIKTFNGLAVRLSDIAAVEQVRVLDTLLSLDGKPCVLLAVSRLPEVEAAAAAKAVRDRLSESAKRFPARVGHRVFSEEAGE
jgi:RND family efflux transporter MFP subunit